MIIKIIMILKFKSLHPFMIIHEFPGRISSSISHSIVILAKDDKLSLDDENLWEDLPRFNQRLDRDDFMNDIEKVIRNIISKMFASRAERENEGKVVIMTMNCVLERYFDEDIDLLSLFVFISSFVVVSRNILSRWSWIDKNTIEFIANDKFQIDWLSKLHHINKLRNTYLKKSLKEVYQFLEEDFAKIIIDIMKLKFLFKESIIFFLAW